MDKSNADLKRKWVREQDIQRAILEVLKRLLSSATPGTGLATETTLALVEGNSSSVATALVSSDTTGAGNIPAGSKAASVFIDGVGGSVNGVVRPDGWSQTFEFNNDTLPLIPYNGNGLATVYVDILT